jgi:hypothetical protein
MATLCTPTQNTKRAIPQVKYAHLPRAGCAALPQRGGHIVLLGHTLLARRGARKVEARVDGALRVALGGPGLALAAGLGGGAGRGAGVCGG